MSLRQQFALLAGLLVTTLLLGNVTITLLNGRTSFEQHLNARAYDAATALALSMSQLQKPDPIQLQRYIDVLFDRGFFSSIELTSTSGEPLHRRALQKTPDDAAPDWFKRWFTLRIRPATADVTSGWQRVGVIAVSSQSEAAYADLWKMVRNETLWFIGVWLCGLIVLHFSLKWLFAPMKTVEEQALAIGERQWQVQTRIPKTRELKRLVLAMNTMVSKLQGMFLEQTKATEQLRSQSYQDSVTQLPNRRGFDQQLQYVLQGSQEHSGVLILLNIAHLSEFNQRFGREQGDAVLKSVAGTMSDWLLTRRHACLGRRSGTDFAIYLECSGTQHADELLQSAFGQMMSSGLAERQGLAFYMGGVFVQSDDPMYVSLGLGEVLSKADMALRQAQRHDHSCALLYQGSPTNDEWSATEWGQRLNAVLDNDVGLTLKFLPVLDAATERPIQFEILSRIECEQQEIPAARFWPMVERHGLADRFDLLVVRQLLQYLRTWPASDGQPISALRFCVNLSPASVISSSFHESLLKVLDEFSDVSSLLALEIPECSLQHAEVSFMDVCQALKVRNVGMGVDRLGTGALSFAYLQRMPLDYVRIDGSFNRGVHYSKDHQFYIQSMVHIAHSLDMKVFADGLEEQQDVDALLSTGIDGMSGHVFSYPLPVSVAQTMLKPA